MAGLGETFASQEVARADDDGDLGANRRNLRDPLGNGFECVTVDPKLARPAETLAREFQQHPMIFTLCHEFPSFVLRSVRDTPVIQPRIGRIA
jgi:hypothetical protein